ncbi:MAG TPA: sensor histidine kinase [Gaiellaceae bacterium]|nr:sensor histidine kinase [Gaiellaceae bacterium]
MSRLGDVTRKYGLDLLIVLLALEAMLEVALASDSPDAPRSTPWFSVPAIAVMVLPLLARRRYPFAAPAAYWLLATGFSFVDGRLVTSMTSVMVLGLTAAFLLGNLRDGMQARIGLAVVLGGAAIIDYNRPGHSTAELVFIPLLFGIGWLGGYALRERAVQAEAAEERAAQAEREREAAARLAVAEERARIARELHDIVAHAVSVMVLQVGAVRHKLPDTLAEDREALTGVERTGRAALAEMRRLLGAMRHDGQDLELTPQPGLDGLDSLLEDVGRAGLPVRLHLDGDRVPLPRALDLSAYRIVQEGLTNALKHARATHADVTLRYGPRELQIEVRDDGRGTSTSDGLGHGLVGVRERVKIYGGEMTAGPAPQGGFVLSTRLPLGGDRA